MRDLRQGSLDVRIDQLRKEAVNLKTAQFTGSDSIRTYLIETTRDWDFEYTEVFTGGQTQSNMHMYIKFIADHQDAPFAKATIEVLVDNSLVYTSGSFDALTARGGIALNGMVRDVYGSYSPTNTPNKRNELSWYNSITFYQSGKNIKIKFRIFATDTGRMIVKTQTDDGETMVIE